MENFREPGLLCTQCTRDTKLVTQEGIVEITSATGQASIRALPGQMSSRGLVAALISNALYSPQPLHHPRLHDGRRD